MKSEKFKDLRKSVLICQKIQVRLQSHKFLWVANSCELLEIYEITDLLCSLRKSSLAHSLENEVKVSLIFIWCYF